MSPLHFRVTKHRHINMNNRAGVSDRVQAEKRGKRLRFFTPLAKLRFGSPKKNKESMGGH